MTHSEKGVASNRRVLLLEDNPSEPAEHYMPIGV